MQNEKTIPEIARAFGVTERQADYAARQCCVEPTRRVGIIRLFDHAAVEQIGDALRRISGKREVAHV